MIAQLEPSEMFLEISMDTKAIQLLSPKPSMILATMSSPHRLELLEFSIMRQYTNSDLPRFRMKTLGCSISMDLQALSLKIEFKPTRLSCQEIGPFPSEEFPSSTTTTPTSPSTSAPVTSKLHSEHQESLVSNLYKYQE